MISFYVFSSFIMKKLHAFWSNVCSKSVNYWALLLCKIFVIWLLLQFFLQTFVTYQLERNGKFWSFFWMWKEFILLIFVVILIRYIIANLKKRTSAIRNKKHVKEISRTLLWNEVKTKFITQFILIFVITLLLFAILALLIQHVGISAFVLSFKYDLIWFFILWTWICLALAFFTEKDKNLLELYRKLITWSLRLWLACWFVVRLMPNVFKIFGFDPNVYEWTVWQNPPAAYYTKIYPWAQWSYVRNSFLFERPTSFGFWLIAFFPVFALWYLRKKSWKEQILPVLAFWLLVLSTWSRAWLAVRAIEAITLFFIIYWKSVKKYFVRLLILAIIGLWGIAYLSRWILVREHSNTGHLVLMKEWLNIASENLVLGRWAWYSWPASHQLCYTDEPVDIYANIDEIKLDNHRCEVLRKANVKNEISTYGFNPENQYLQILMEYGIIWIIFWLWLCGIVLRYTWKMIRIYRKKNKSPYQELLYYCLLWFGIGFVWLCAEWLVLHSLSDRMITYPFFLLYWITIWLREKEKNREYIAPEKQKKKKKAGWNKKAIAKKSSAKKWKPTKKK